MSFERVRAWRDIGRRVDASMLGTGLSASGAHEAWNAAFDALDDSALASVEAMGGRPFQRAVIIAAETVPTAPIEWCAVLLARGSSVTLKHSRSGEGVASVLVEAARQVQLPFSATKNRDVLTDADLVVAMGSDETIGAIRRDIAPNARFLAHGHRFSAAWLTGGALPADPLVPAGFSDSFGAICADAILHDGRGCLSPGAVLTTLPLTEACDRLAEAFTRATLRWPAGRISPMEAATLRTRRAVARTVGYVREGDGWSIHGLPREHFSPTGLPRSISVTPVADVAQAVALVAPYARALSTIGTDDPSAANAWLSAGATRVCRLGRMQRPPLLRPHDGEDWIRASARWVSNEV